LTPESWRHCRHGFGAVFAQQLRMSPSSGVPWSTARRVVTFAVAVFVINGCTSAIQKVQTPNIQDSLGQIWRAPTDLTERDLFYGAGGRALAPGRGPYALISIDKTGASPGYDVKDNAGRTWSLKLGEEAQPEIVTSRVLWALGFHQDPIYYVSEWSFSGSTKAPTPPARFRLERESRDVIADWSWRQNPFIGTRPYSALIVANILLNNWDWKTNNNKIYAVRDPAGNVRREYVVRDLGAALGSTTTYPRWLQWTHMRAVLQGTKNDLRGFERQPFIKHVDGDRVTFHYKGIHQDLLRFVKTDDVVWTCQQLARVTDKQWNDAFRAAGYSTETSARYVAHIKSKIAEGVALADRKVTSGRAA
jgi:hypothetical protein